MHDPFSLIRESIDSAIQNADRNAALLFLATSDSNRQPSIRTLLLREIRGHSLLILFSKLHQKWTHLQETGNFEVLLWYPSIGHQYRIRGAFTEATPEERQACWANQPDVIRQVDLAYGDRFAPGISIDDPREFHSKVRSQPVEDRQITSPPDHVIAAWLTANTVEQLIESPDRLHSRTRFIWQHGIWHEEQLIP